MPDEEHISLWDLYQAILALDKRVSVMETAVAAFVKSNDDHEGRIRAGERWQYAIPPAILGSLAAAVIALIK